MLKKRSTKQILADSVQELLCKNPIQNISVRDITLNCNISTRSFYNHFKDKQDLICWIYLQKEAELFSNIKKGISLYDSLLALFNFAYDNRSFFANTITYSGQNNLTESITAQAKQTLISTIQKNDETDSLNMETLFAIDFWIHGVNEMARFWMNSSKDITPAKLMELIEFSTPPRLLPYIRKTTEE